MGYFSYVGIFYLFVGFGDCVLFNWVGVGKFILFSGDYGLIWFGKISLFLG